MTDGVLVGLICLKCWAFHECGVQSLLWRQPRKDALDSRMRRVTCNHPPYQLKNQDECITAKGELLIRERRDAVNEEYITSFAREPSGCCTFAALR